MARGLEVLARLAVMEGKPDDQRAAGRRDDGAAGARRSCRRCPARGRSGSWTRRRAWASTPSARLWAEGEAMTSSGAVRLALGEPDADPAELGRGAGTGQPPRPTRRTGRHRPATSAGGAQP